MIVESLKNSIGKSVIFFNDNGFRFEGKILDVSGEFLRYYDTHKGQERFVRIESIREIEVVE